MRLKVWYTNNVDEEVTNYYDNVSSILDTLSTITIFFIHGYGSKVTIDKKDARFGMISIFMEN